jgi:predicted ABC-type ATPase
MAQPRFRMFAGPNGSGKTSLFKTLKNESFIHTEVYVNADEIEQKLSQELRFNFNAYRVKVSDEDFKNHIRRSGILKKIRDKSFMSKIEIASGILKLRIRKAELNSYIASFIASYLALKLFETRQSFCYETVLSHPSKLSFFTRAKHSGYKSYLYFIATDNLELNIERVKLRVQLGGHDVNTKKIGERYFRSLRLFKQAARLAESAFLIDNSQEFKVMTELKNNKVVFVDSSYPFWLKKYYNPEK